MWLLLASSLGLFLLGGIVAELAADTSESAVAPYPGWQEPFDLAAYAAAFAAARAAGVEVYAIGCAVTPDRIEVDKTVELLV